MLTDNLTIPLTTRQKVVELRRQHPEYTQTQIAREVCRTKERVRQILYEERLPGRAVREKKLTLFLLEEKIRDLEARIAQLEKRGSLSRASPF